MVPSPLRTTSRALGALAVLLAVVAAGFLLAPRPLADVFFAGWVVVAVGIALAGGFAAWTNRRGLLWVAALALTALAIVGMWSLGFFVAPAALCLLLAAVLAQFDGRREPAGRTVADPPTVPEAILKTLAGCGALAGGGALVYVGAFTRELFGACASETLSCALGNADWGAIVVTLLGLAALGLGVWLLWRQVSVARVLASRPAE